MSIFKSIKEAKKNQRKQFALLVDPDKCDLESLSYLIEKAAKAKVDFILVGGSLLLKDRVDACLRQIKQICDIPALLFPGNVMQISKYADGILFLSLISGRNPDLLIGQQVIAAPYLKQANLEIISTGYILIDGGVPTSVSYVSNTTPIPRTKKEIAYSTALAGEMLGLKMIYLDAGSGAKYHVDESMVNLLSEGLSAPIFVGGGIRTPLTAYNLAKAGADVIVVGNVLEESPDLLEQMVSAVHQIHVKQK
jgi:putative glycerol-1-phosphate prenyltransferase